jgi:hypothetical protein
MAGATKIQAEYPQNEFLFGMLTVLSDNERLHPAPV